METDATARRGRAYFFLALLLPRAMVGGGSYLVCMSHFAFDFSVFIRFFLILLFIIILGYLLSPFS